MVSSRESFPKGRILSWICWGAILLMALLFRMLPIRSGLPYSDYVDEGPIGKRRLPVLARPDPDDLDADEDDLDASDDEADDDEADSCDGEVAIELEDGDFDGTD